MSARLAGQAGAIIRAGAVEPSRPWPRHMLTVEGWTGLALALADDPSLDLLALWADTARVYALFTDASGAVLPVSAPVVDGVYAALSPHRPAAAWLERAVRDLWGHIAQTPFGHTPFGHTPSGVGGIDMRPWLDHGRWANTHPMALRPVPTGSNPEPPEFLPVDGAGGEGEDLHQLPLGPVRAGLLECAHIRLTARGETVVRAEVRLGYAHKGILTLMRGKQPRAAARFAARLSGDATVAHSIAYASAAEAALAIEAPPRALALRAVMAELERIASHLGDAAAITAEAGFPFLPARFGWHREAMLHAAAAVFGHRLMMDCVVPGGVAADILPDSVATLLAALAVMEAELPSLIATYDSHASLVDRMTGTGTVDTGQVNAFAAGGVVARASGRGVDARRSPGYPPYAALDFNVPVLAAGDADARLRVRLAELRESAALMRVALASLPEGTLNIALPTGSGEGFGVAESPRGDVWHWLRLDGGLVASAYARDPSWLHWPLLEAAMTGAPISDLPLCERSFNCSSSGVDL